MTEYLAVISANCPHEVLLFKVIEDYTERFSSIEELLDSDDRGDFIKQLFPDETYSEQSSIFSYRMAGTVSVFVTERVFF